MGRAAVPKSTGATSEADRTGEREFPTAFQVQSRDPAWLGEEWGAGCIAIAKKGKVERARDCSFKYRTKE